MIARVLGLIGLLAVCLYALVFPAEVLSLFRAVSSAARSNPEWAVTSLALLVAVGATLTFAMWVMIRSRAVSDSRGIASMKRARALKSDAESDSGDWRED